MFFAAKEKKLLEERGYKTWQRGRGGLKKFKKGYMKLGGLYCR